MTRMGQLWFAKQVANLFAGYVPFRRRCGGERSNISSGTASLGMTGKGRIQPVVRLAIAKGFLAEYAKLDKGVAERGRCGDRQLRQASSCRTSPGEAAAQPGRPDPHHPDRRPLVRYRPGSRQRRHVLPDHGPAAREGECLRHQSPVQRQPGARSPGSSRRGGDPATATVPSSSCRAR